jgi:hypothetical protein
MLAVSLVLALCLLDPVAALLAKNAVDLFALGHSPAKTYALLGFVLLVLGAVASPLRTPPAKTEEWLGRALLLCALYSSLEFFLFCRRFQVPARDWAAALRDGFWSSTSLEHMHTCKALLAPLFGGLAAVTDAGYPFQPFFPAILVDTHLLLFVAVLALATACGVRVYRERPPGEATTLVLCIFALAKNTVDGGPLSPEVWAALPFVASLGGGRRAGRWAALLLFCYCLTVRRPYDTVLWRLPTNLLALGLPLLWERLGWPAAARTSLLGAVGLAIYLSPWARWKLDPSFGWQPQALNI